jgi:hypothetical protein
MRLRAQVISARRALGERVDANTLCPTQTRRSQRPVLSVVELNPHCRFLSEAEEGSW